ncbi:MAG: alanine dehydrogenase [Pseudomonadota bacterium]|nr:alanine dehydrogenase [Pseudomonadota bacterium]
MKIAIPKEVKPLEGRVALIPEACAQLVAHGNSVFVQSGAGLASGYEDAAYVQAGAQIQPDAASLYGAGELIVKVKDPVPAEWPLLRRDHTLFSFLHLAPNPELADALCASGATALAFETVLEGGQLPVLAPMSEIAGRIAIQVGAHLLHSPQGGRGLLLGGITGVPRGHVVVIGCGNVGLSAIRAAAGLGAQVTAFDLNRERLAQAGALGENVTPLYPYAQALASAAAEADLLVGAVLVTGARAPHVIDEATVQQMPKGSVIVDVAVDQGGCVATTEPRGYDDPVYEKHGVLHFSVTNMPGAVPRTASQGLSAVLLPYVSQLASERWRENPVLEKAVNVEGGRNRLAENWPVDG